jgi:hypothetical protein
MLCVCVRAHTCSLSYPAYKAYAPYYIVLCGLSGCTIYFSHHLINGTVFRKKSYSTYMCILIFVTTFSEIFLILRIIHRDIIINAHVFMQRTYYSCQILIKLEFYEQIFKKHISNVMKVLHLEPSCSMQMDMTKLIVIFFFNFVNVPKK